VFGGHAAAAAACSQLDSSSAGSKANYRLIESTGTFVADWQLSE